MKSLHVNLPLLSDAKRAKVIDKLHPIVVIGPEDRLVVRTFPFYMADLKDRYAHSGGVLVSEVRSVFGYDDPALSVDELTAVNSAMKDPDHDFVSVIRFQCGSFDVQAVSWE